MANYLAMECITSDLLSLTHLYQTLAFYRLPEMGLSGPISRMIDVLLTQHAGTLRIRVKLTLSAIFPLCYSEKIKY